MLFAGPQFPCNCHIYVLLSAIGCMRVLFFNMDVTPTSPSVHARLLGDCGCLALLSSWLWPRSLVTVALLSVAIAGPVPLVDVRNELHPLAGHYFHAGRPPLFSDWCLLLGLEFALPRTSGVPCYSGSTGPMIPPIIFWLIPMSIFCLTFGIWCIARTHPVLVTKGQISRLRGMCPTLMHSAEGMPAFG